MSSVSACSLRSRVDTWCLPVIVIARNICLFCFGLAMSLPLVPTHYFVKNTVWEAMSFYQWKFMLWIFLSHSLSSCLFFLSVDLFFSLKETADTGNALLLCLLYFNSTPVSTFCFSCFHLSPHFLSPSALELFQWASNWGSVIGREKWLGEKWKAVEGEKKGKAIIKSLI